MVLDDVKNCTRDYDKQILVNKTIIPLLNELPEDVMIHTLQIAIDRYGEERHMSVSKKCQIAFSVYEGLNELRENM